MITLTDLITPMAQAEASASLYDVLATLGVPTASWKPGGVLRTIIAVVAVVLAAVTTAVSLLARAAFRSTAFGSWLTLLAREVYGCERIGATYATTTVTFTNAGGGIYTYAAGALIVASSKSKKQYRNDVACTIAALTTTDVEMTAVEAGTGSIAQATEIDTIVSTMVGVTCSNASAALASDEETDTQLRARCDARLDSLSPNGPAGAYLYVAMTAVSSLTGASLGVTRVTTSVDSATSTVSVYVATASGAVTGTVGSAGTALDDVNNAIQTQCVPLGVTANVYSAIEHELDPEYTIWVSSSAGYTTDKDVTNLVDAALAAYCATIPIGGQAAENTNGYVYLDAISEKIRAAVPGVIKVKMGYPSGDVLLDIDEVAIPGDITCLGVVFV